MNINRKIKERVDCWIKVFPANVNVWSRLNFTMLGPSRALSVLTKRIVWFEPAIASPSANHAWYIWKRIPTYAFEYATPSIWYHYA